ncbi:glycosyltransferase [Salegentibacter sp. JZCK2]|uniref:glycosyltransferase n=1 Tax=Salegentibacter tibetensis TaxID=2873600 RepID=UPI001CCF005F|nr:glycosyltransferase [Salegentibacter tibetensis]MBZ9731291.1 glycosyltransferase [Salegentibacter tibetensis]
MNIVIFTHPAIRNFQSIGRYTKMLATGMKQRKHKVRIITSKNYFSRLPHPKSIDKWLAYLDQYLIFPLQFKRNKKSYSPKTLFVFADQALGLWIPLIGNRPHIIHCHDFMAQRSALGQISNNKVGITGKLYQYFIRMGYRQGKNFISISNNTQQDLHKFLNGQPTLSEVVYNGFNQEFKPVDNKNIPMILSRELGIGLKNGFILHVGGNQFYKNRKGVVEIYNSWRRVTEKHLPLIMVGAPPDDTLKTIWKDSPFADDIHFIENASDNILKMCYQAASILLFPSLNEGFGWPIAEALASGCPVITTNKAPMTEVGGNCCTYIPSYPEEKQSQEEWAYLAAEKLEIVLNLSEKELSELKRAGLKYSSRFNTNNTLDRIETLYKGVLQNHLQES